MSSSRARRRHSRNRASEAVPGQDNKSARQSGSDAGTSSQEFRPVSVPDPGPSYDSTARRSPDLSHLKEGPSVASADLPPQDAPPTWQPPVPPSVYDHWSHRRLAQIRSWNWTRIGLTAVAGVVAVFAVLGAMTAINWFFGPGNPESLEAMTISYIDPGKGDQNSVYTTDGSVLMASDDVLGNAAAGSNWLATVELQPYTLQRVVTDLKPVDSVPQAVTVQVPMPYVSPVPVQPDTTFPDYTPYSGTDAFGYPRLGGPLWDINGNPAGEGTPDCSTTFSSPFGSCGKD